MADNLSVKVDGLDDLKRVLAEIPMAMRKKVLLAALRKAARVPLRVARQLVPVLSVADATKTPNRTPGLLKKRLAVRLSKAARAAGNVGVFVNVKPASGAKYTATRSRGLIGTYTTYRLKKASARGAKSKLDPYYWRFVEFGTKKMTSRPFLQNAAASLPEALDVFMAEVIPQINRFNTRK